MTEHVKINISRDPSTQAIFLYVYEPNATMTIGRREISLKDILALQTDIQKYLVGEQSQKNNSCKGDSFYLLKHGNHYVLKFHKNGTGWKLNISKYDLLPLYNEASRILAEPETIQVSNQSQQLQLS